MSKLAAGYFNKTVTNKEAGINWPHRSVALIPFQKSDHALMKLIENETITVKPIDEYFDDFDINTSNANSLFTHIGSGIGDIIALSALTKFLSAY